ncbi:hypothetical protein MCP1_190064 [Candidatus Terasakiella magnetica]|nr:hypothetical protein MCP1_190064 [Candidatus Terasakiella magnetica]
MAEQLAQNVDEGAPPPQSEADSAQGASSGPQAPKGAKGEQVIDPDAAAAAKERTPTGQSSGTSPTADIGGASTTTTLIGPSTTMTGGGESPTSGASSIGGQPLTGSSSGIGNAVPGGPPIAGLTTNIGGSGFGGPSGSQFGASSLFAPPSIFSPPPPGGLSFVASQGPSIGALPLSNGISSFGSLSSISGGFQSSGFGKSIVGAWDLQAGLTLPVVSQLPVYYSNNISVISQNTDATHREIRNGEHSISDSGSTFTKGKDEADLSASWQLFLGHHATVTSATIYGYNPIDQREIISLKMSVPLVDMWTGINKFNKEFDILVRSEYTVSDIGKIISEMIKNESTDTRTAYDYYCDIMTQDAIDERVTIDRLDRSWINDYAFKQYDSFNPKIAMNSALLSTLAYENNDFISYWLQNHGLTLNGSIDTVFGNQAFLASESNGVGGHHYVLAFRGTAGLADIIRDASAAPGLGVGVNGDVVNVGVVHSGFQGLASDGMSLLSSGEISEIAAGISDITFVGHSLGGAAADIAAVALDHYFQNRGIDRGGYIQAYTIAAPAPIDYMGIFETGIFEYDLNINARVFGLEEARDPVPNSSYIADYDHIGKRYIFGSIDYDDLGINGYIPTKNIFVDKLTYDGINQPHSLAESNASPDGYFLYWGELVDGELNGRQFWDTKHILWDSHLNSALTYASHHSALGMYDQFLRAMNYDAAYISSVHSTEVQFAPRNTEIVEISGLSEDATIYISSASLLENAFDLNGDSLKIGSISVSSGVVTAINSFNNNWAVIPEKDFNGDIVINYTIVDESGIEIGTHAVAHIAPVNDAPQASDFALDVYSGAVIEFSIDDFADHFVDVDGDPLSSVKVVSLPQLGGLSLNGQAVSEGQEISAANIGGLTYTPNASGNDSFTWLASDGLAFSAQNASMDITISNINNTHLGYIEDFSGDQLSYGHGYNLKFVDTPTGRGVTFEAQSESRLEYPIGESLQQQGTIEFLISVNGGYGYNETDYRFGQYFSEYYENNTAARIFDTGGGDSWRPGTSWLTVESNGTVSWSTVELKNNAYIVNNLTAQNTTFQFGGWHSIGISYGDQGQYMMVDGHQVAADAERTSSLSTGGKWGWWGAEGWAWKGYATPQIGEWHSSLWPNDIVETGFIGTLDTFRISDQQKDWYVSAQCVGADPIVFDLNHDGKYLNDTTAPGVPFDLHSDGSSAITRWFSPNDAVLAIDSEQNGQIQGMGELFADLSGKLTSTEVLATFDLNHDECIDDKDDVFRDLIVWSDRNSNGISEVDEMSSLRDAGIISIDLHTTPSPSDVDPAILSHGTATMADGSSLNFAEVIFQEVPQVIDQHV